MAISRHQNNALIFIKKPVTRRVAIIDTRDKPRPQPHTEREKQDSGIFNQSGPD